MCLFCICKRFYLLYSFSVYKITILSPYMREISYIMLSVTKTFHWVFLSRAPGNMDEWRNLFNSHIMIIKYPSD